jgi:hypothetical protein
MKPTRIIGNVRLVCDDTLPYHLIATHGQSFRLIWQERHPHGWSGHVRTLGPEARELVGADSFDPRLLRAMFIDPDEAVVLAGDVDEKRPRQE